eukprot:TRINITY_DN5456_c0_g5_i1.p2 TRINITY_DN5456_c0_g5~~TRINITY_DN5456_c0_g5_i1.p2  ORF type:complete len:123 (+),score=25.90 TRINITY_DN5456_c0_g5_i1:171-539(+)
MDEANLQPVNIPELFQINETEMEREIMEAMDIMAKIFESMMTSADGAFEMPAEMPEPGPTVVHIEVKQLRTPSQSVIESEEGNPWLRWFTSSQTIEMRLAIYLGFVVIAILLYYAIAVEACI